MAGYSGTPLAKKLGIKAGHSVALLNAPENFESQLEGMPEDVVLARDLKSAAAHDVIVLFAANTKQLHGGFSRCSKKLASNGGLWVAWHKKTSPHASELTENEVRNHGLDTGLVDNKICAIDEHWSGLRFVVRLVNRPK